MISCGLCDDVNTERRIHVAAMDEYHEHFLREYRHLMQEYKRIEELLRDVVWYNFETVARSWKSPWPETLLDSHLELHAQRYVIVQVRGGRQCERAEFPYYYAGPVRDAPTLPPAIVLHELKLAWEAVKEAETSCAAPYEWAPGGQLYCKLLRESEGVKAYAELSSKVRTDSDGGRRETCEAGAGLQLGDPMEWTPTEDEETTAKDILGRVCGDRSLVCPRTRG